MAYKYNEWIEVLRNFDGNGFDDLCGGITCAECKLNNTIKIGSKQCNICQSFSNMRRALEGTKTNTRVENIIELLKNFDDTNFCRETDCSNCVLYICVLLREASNFIKNQGGEDND